MDEANGRRPWRVVEDEISGLLDRVDGQQFERLLSAFQNRGGRTFFSGQGRSGLIAQMVAMRFMQTGLPVHVVGEATAPAIGRGDRFVLICGSGKTPISVSFARIAKDHGAELIVVTHKPDSALADMADLVLSVPMKSTIQFGGTLFEQACLILFDTLALQLTGHDEAAYASMWARHTNLQ